VFARLNWDRIDEGRLDLLKGIIREHTGALLRTMVKARDSGCVGRSGTHVSALTGRSGKRPRLARSRRN
jgi:hypothetical protein